MPELYLTPEIRRLLADPRTVVVGSLSGGKDSTVYLDYLKKNYPALDVRLVFADTGAEYQAEPGKWPSTLEWCIKIAAKYGCPLTVVHNTKRNLLEEIEQRRRFPSPHQRWCTAHHKRGPIHKYLRSIEKAQGYAPLQRGGELRRSSVFLMLTIEHVCCTITL